MPRIVGVDIPDDKSIWISLTYIVGIGKHTSKQILKEAGIDSSMKAKKLSEDELSHITQIIDRNYIVEGFCGFNQARSAKFFAPRISAVCTPSTVCSLGCTERIR